MIGAGLVLAYMVWIHGEGRMLTNSCFAREVRLQDLPTLTERASTAETVLAGSGSGFFINPDGYLITNSHVCEGAEELVVVYGSQAYRAELVALNTERDLALLRIVEIGSGENAEGERQVQVRKFPYLSPARGRLQVGQDVYVAGFPKVTLQGMEAKVTRGIVSSLTGFAGDERIFQLDAAIQGGNSGGPVVDMNGQVLGITVASLRGGQNVNYAIKLSEVDAFLPPLGVRFAPMERNAGLRSGTRAVNKALAAVALILNFQKTEGRPLPAAPAAEEDAAEGSESAEAVSAIRKALLCARLGVLRKEWKVVLELTDGIIAEVGAVEDVREMNDRARDELGLHLVLTAEVDGHDVAAKVTPLTGFRDERVECGKPLALKGATASDFPVRARLEFRDRVGLWVGEVNLVYDWHGTRRERVKLHLSDATQKE